MNQQSRQNSKQSYRIGKNYKEIIQKATKRYKENVDQNIILKFKKQLKFLTMLNKCQITKY